MTVKTISKIIAVENNDTVRCFLMLQKHKNFYSQNLVL